MSFNKDDSPDRLLKEIDDASSQSPSEEREDAGGTGESAVEDSDEEDTSSNVPAAQSGGAGGQGSTGSSNVVGQGASLLRIGQTWQYQMPMATPLSYEVTINAAGGVEVRTLQGNVNFGDRNSIKLANRYLHQQRSRSRESAGLPPVRPNLNNRAMTQAQHNFIIAEYHAYAAANNNARMSNPELTRRFNLRFQETPPRTPQSLSGYVSRWADIQAIKYSYN